MTQPNAAMLAKALVSKDASFSEPRVSATSTIVCKETYPEAGGNLGRHRSNARDRRAVRDKQARRQRQQDHFTDSTAFAYYSGWPLEMRITITWDACTYGDQNEGHILGMSDDARNERLRIDLARRLRNEGHTFACIWARDKGPKLGLHTHLGLFWPLGKNKLVQLLAHLSGSPPSLARLPRDVVAQSECGGWQIKCNTAQNRLRSAMSWATYLRDQGERHLIVPRITGKVLGVSRSLGFSAVGAQKTALDAWKRRVGWNSLETAEIA